MLSGLFACGSQPGGGDGSGGFVGSGGQATITCSCPSEGTTNYDCSSAGECVFDSCKEGYGDCDASPDNGCEVDLSEDAHCGSCDSACNLNLGGASNQTEACLSGQCSLVCESGFRDVDSDPQNGCEEANYVAQDSGCPSFPPTDDQDCSYYPDCTTTYVQPGTSCIITVTCWVKSVPALGYYWIVNGPLCDGRAVGQPCQDAAECASGKCEDDLCSDSCVEKTCGIDRGVDCGACENGLACEGDEDCASGACCETPDDTLICYEECPADLAEPCDTDDDCFPEHFCSTLYNYDEGPGYCSRDCESALDCITPSGDLLTCWAEERCNLPPP